MRPVITYLGFLLTAIVATEAAAMTGTLDAVWSLDRVWPHSNTLQNWTDAQDWQAQSEVDLGLQQNGFTVLAHISDTAVSLNELYYDLSWAGAEWSVGRKPQEWAYGYSQSALNWVDEDLMLMREQFFSFGSWQSWCYSLDDTAGCANRLSGWFNNADWQMMIDFREYWRAGLAVQTLIGDGGLVYAELYSSEMERYTQLTAIGPEVHIAGTEEGSQHQVNLGAQWTFPFKLTLQTEFRWMQQGLNSNDWNTIHAQLGTASAAMVGAAFAEPLAQQQWMVRFAQPWRDFNIENVSIYWPQANHSLFNRTQIGVDINATLSAEISWEHHVKGSVLNDIGQGNRVAIQFQFTDGF